MDCSDRADNILVVGEPEQVRAHRRQISEMLRKQFPGAVPMMEAARDDVLAFLCFPSRRSTGA